MPVIEGTLGPIFQTTDPVNGTNETQTLTIGTTPTSGTWVMGFGGISTPPITWHATTSNLLANINAVLSGVAEVQRLTIGGTPTGGTFQLEYRGQVSGAITWSATDATLQTNVDNALEAMGYFGTGSIATSGADGTMNDGIGYLVLTWAVKGAREMIRVYSNRLTGTTPTVAVTRATTGYVHPALGPDGVVATETSLAGGAGTILLTFSGAEVKNKVQALLTIVSNDLVGTGATLAVEETTAGVSASFYGAPANALLIANGHQYLNAGTPAAPSWKQMPFSAVGVYPKTPAGVKTLMTAAPVARTVMMLVVIDEVFGAGNGQATVFDFGETDTAQKFKASLNAGSAGATLTYGGTLSAGKALIITVTAATGTGTGGITVMAVTS